jgi:hypothetical protein
VEADSEYLVTGDKGILKLGSYGSTQIVTPAQFFEIVAGPQRGRQPTSSARQSDFHLAVVPERRALSFTLFVVTSEFSFKLFHGGKDLQQSPFD